MSQARRWEQLTWAAGATGRVRQEVLVQGGEALVGEVAGAVAAVEVLEEVPAWRWGRQMLWWGPP